MIFVIKETLIILTHTMYYATNIPVLLMTVLQRHICQLVLTAYYSLSVFAAPAVITVIICVSLSLCDAGNDECTHLCIV